MKAYYTYAFEKLEVWQLARQMRNRLFDLSKTLPADERFELVSQIRRSSASSATNLAEGSGRASDVDKSHFVNTAYTSALETINHLITAFDRKYISEESYVEFRIAMDELINKLNGYYKFIITSNTNLRKRT